MSRHMRQQMYRILCLQCFEAKRSVNSPLKRLMVNKIFLNTEYSPNLTSVKQACYSSPQSWAVYIMRRNTSPFRTEIFFTLVARISSQILRKLWLTNCRSAGQAGSISLIPAKCLYSWRMIWPFSLIFPLATRWRRIFWHKCYHVWFVVAVTVEIVHMDLGSGFGWSRLNCRGNNWN